MKKMNRPASTKSPAPAGAESLLSMEEAIVLLKTTRPTFYSWLKTGKLRGMKVGRQWRFYRKDVDGFLRGEGLRYDLPVGVEPLLAALRNRIGEKGGSVSSLSDAEKLEMASALTIRVGTALKASDIHLDAVGDTGRLRYRVNGILTVGAEFDGRLGPALITRFKAMAKGAVDVHNLPQDYRIRHTVDGADLDLRMCFLPSVTGETMTIRILYPGVASVRLEDLTAGNPVKDALVSAFSARTGMVIVAGPTGSGKTSLLYGCVNHLATPQDKVISIEDPVEYAIPGVVQVIVNKNIGLTAAAALKAVLRSDPNIIVVGEVRDPETADLACKAAMTGHLVLSAMFAKDAANVLARLMDMGVPPQTLADSLRMVTCQRLVRKVCDACGRKDKPSAELMAWAREAAPAGGVPWESVKDLFMKGPGCAKCNGTGFRGRSLVIEWMKVDGEMTAVIGQGDPAKARALALKRGMRTMEADAIRQAGEGITSLAEARRATE